MAGWGLVRIALLSDCYLPRLGGIEIQVHDLAGELVRVGHEVAVFTATGARDAPRGCAPTLDARGVTVHRFDLGLPGGIPVNPFAVGEVRRRLRAGAYDVAHAHMGVVSPFAMDMVRVCLGIDLPVAVTWHCVLDASVRAHAAVGYARRWSARGAALSAVSAMAAARVARTVPAGTTVGVLNNGIDATRWQRPASPSPGHVSELDRAPGREHPLQVVAVQRLASRKRPLALVDVVRRARELAPGTPIELVLVGDGPVRARLASVAERERWLTLPGRLPREELRLLLWSAHVFLSTTKLEAFGIAALEARTAGLPVVALRDNGIGDFIEHGTNGLLAGDDAGLAAAVASLASEPDLWRRIASHNRAVLPAQCWPQVVRATLAEYDRAISGEVVIAGDPP